MVDAECDVRVAVACTLLSDVGFTLSRRELVRQQQSDRIAQPCDESCLGRAKTDSAARAIETI